MVEVIIFFVGIIVGVILGYYFRKRQVRHCRYQIAEGICDGEY